MISLCAKLEVRKLVSAVLILRIVSEGSSFTNSQDRKNDQRFSFHRTVIAVRLIPSGVCMPANAKGNSVPGSGVRLTKFSHGSLFMVAVWNRAEHYIFILCTYLWF